MAGDEPPQDGPLTGPPVGPSYYAVVVLPGGGDPVCGVFNDRPALAAFVRGQYDLARSGVGGSRARLYVFEGARVVLTGGADRVLVFPDGERLTIAQPPRAPDQTDVLLAPGDAVVLPPLPPSPPPADR